jgi:hypothetical protein
MSSFKDFREVLNSYTKGVIMDTMSWSLFGLHEGVNLNPVLVELLTPYSIDTITEVSGAMRYGKESIIDEDAWDSELFAKLCQFDHLEVLRVLCERVFPNRNFSLLEYLRASSIDHAEQFMPELARKVVNGT